MTRTDLRQSAYRAAKGMLAVPTEPGLCLALVRIVVEDAFYGGSREFYSNYMVAGAATRSGSDSEKLAAAWRSPWANDMDASFRKLGMTVPLEQAKVGDLLFNNQSAYPYGHVGILIESGLVLENIDPAYRPGSFHTAAPNQMLTPLEDIPWTTCVRLVADNAKKPSTPNDNGLIRVYDADNREVFRMPVGEGGMVRQTMDVTNRRIHVRVEREERE